MPSRSVPMTQEGREALDRGQYEVPRILYGFDATSGKILWSFDLHARDASYPSVADGVLYIGSGDGHLYALDAGTGKLKWQFRAGGAVFSAPCIADGVVYFGCDDGKVYALH